MKQASRYFFILALLSFLGGILLGCMTGVQFMLPTVLNDVLPFYKTRPLHVALAIWWIFLAATGCVYYFVAELQNDEQLGFRKQWIESPASRNLALLHLGLWFFSGVAIAVCYLSGVFGGREYLNFPPIISLPILLGWIVFAVNIYRAIGPLRADWPIFLWMWSTCLFFFVISFTEAHLWLLPWFSSNVVRETTVQWKSYGALVASWNMLIYGLAMCVMYVCNAPKRVVNGFLPFSLYFIALTNSMFNWGHHTYTVPAPSWVREVAYIVSMTELLILARILWIWKKSWREHCDEQHLRYRLFFLAADIWILLNLCLALVLSVPALNVYLHGTHAVVAHAMGSTIGINSMILFAALYYIVSSKDSALATSQRRIFRFAFFGLQASLLVFWLGLIGAGVRKSMLLSAEPTRPYRTVIEGISPFIHSFVGSGFILAGCFVLMVLPLLRFFISRSRFADSTQS